MAAKLVASVPHRAVVALQLIDTLLFAVCALAVPVFRRPDCFESYWTFLQDLFVPKHYLITRVLLRHNVVHLALYAMYRLTNRFLSERSVPTFTGPHALPYVEFSPHKRTSTNAEVRAPHWVAGTAWGWVLLDVGCPLLTG